MKPPFWPFRLSAIHRLDKMIQASPRLLRVTTAQPPLFRLASGQGQLTFYSLFFTFFTFLQCDCDETPALQFSCWRGADQQRQVIYTLPFFGEGVFVFVLLEKKYSASGTTARFEYSFFGQPDLDRTAGLHLASCWTRDEVWRYRLQPGQLAHTCRLTTSQNYEGDRSDNSSKVVLRSFLRAEGKCEVTQQ